MIKELIVVEGKDDISAVKRAVDANVICTGGYGITESIMSVIKSAAANRGVILFTDPDFAGDKIRRNISEKVHGCKHAYLPRHLGTKNNNVGIENASPQDIVEALSKVQTITQGQNTFSVDDMNLLGLVNHSHSQKLRRFVGELLGMGYCNGKQFLIRLNNFGITRKQLMDAVEKYHNQDV